MPHLPRQVGEILWQCRRCQAVHRKLIPHCTGCGRSRRTRTVPLSAGMINATKAFNAGTPIVENPYDRDTFDWWEYQDGVEFVVGFEWVYGPAREWWRWSDRTR